MGNRIDNRARGNAPQLLEKYKTLARDAQQAGDRVLAEYYFQFADHYFRVLAESRARYEEANPNRPRQDYAENDGFDNDEGEGGDDDFDQPRYHQQPSRVQQDERSQREDRPQRDDRYQQQDRQPGNDRPQQERPQPERPQSERVQQERVAQDRQERQPRENRYRREPDLVEVRTLEIAPVANGSTDEHDEPLGLPFDALPPSIGMAALDPVPGVEGEPVSVPRKRGRPRKVAVDVPAEG